MLMPATSDSAAVRGRGERKRRAVGTAATAMQAAREARAEAAQLGGGKGRGGGMKWMKMRCEGGEGGGPAVDVACDGRHLQAAAGLRVYQRFMVNGCNVGGVMASNGLFRVQG